MLEFGNTGFATEQLAFFSEHLVKHCPRQRVLVELSLNYCNKSNHQLSQVCPQGAHAAGQERMETNKHQVLKWMDKG